jgi:hypothetical protein
MVMGTSGYLIDNDTAIKLWNAGIRAVAISLIINELESNELKHAFPDERKGTINVPGKQIGPDQLQFVFRDDGIGMPSDHDWKNTGSLGLRLVTA